MFIVMAAIVSINNMNVCKFKAKKLRLTTACCGFLHWSMFKPWHSMAMRYGDAPIHLRSLAICTEVIYVAF